MIHGSAKCDVASPSSGVIMWLCYQLVSETPDVEVCSRKPVAVSLHASISNRGV
jgi:hypothetical protein